MANSDDAWHVLKREVLFSPRANDRRYWEEYTSYVRGEQGNGRWAYPASYLSPGGYLMTCNSVMDLIQPPFDDCWKKKVVMWKQRCPTTDRHQIIIAERKKDSTLGEDRVITKLNKRRCRVNIYSPRMMRLYKARGLEGVPKADEWFHRESKAGIIWKYRTDKMILKNAPWEYVLMFTQVEHIVVNDNPHKHGGRVRVDHEVRRSVIGAFEEIEDKQP